MSHRAWSRAIASIGVAACLAVASSARAGLPDAWVTAKVKMALLTTPDVGGARIDVDTDDGQVTLHGLVTKEDQRAEAERAASEVAGVRAIRNLLQVVPEHRAKAVRIADAALKAQVSAVLKAHPDLDGISPKSVHAGVVLLEGRAERLSDHLEALEVVANVGGVRRVESEIHSPDRFGDHEVWFSDEPTPTGHGAVMKDAWITAKTKFRLMTEPDLPARDIHVDTRGGRVVLFGIVPTPAARAKAKELAAGVAGVRGVQDELTVVPREEQVHATAQDDELAKIVRQKLADAGLEGADIEVEVNAAVARLSGSVGRAADRYAAVKITSTTDGVASVRDDLRVEAVRTTGEGGR